jgi:tetratricopeptide (TPR) repeat protein
MLEIALEHHLAGRFDDAAQAYQQVLAADPCDSEVAFLMGVLCCDLGVFEAARQFLERALLLAPQFPLARAQLAAALNGLSDQSATAGRLDDAERLLMQALESAPNDAQSLAALGRLALLRSDAATAETRLLASLTARPHHADTLNCLGLARLQLEKLAAAEAPLRLALDLEPEHNQARNNLGLTLYRMGRLIEALRCFEEAVARDPGYRNARINLANTLRTLGRHARAQAELETVVAAFPEAADALSNLGTVYQDQGKTELALSALTRASAAAPSSATIRWNLSLTQLLLGDFKNGWAGFESRWEGCGHLRGGYRMPAQRAWRGESLQGRRLLLWAEQGFGDTLQFVRFAQDAAHGGALVSLLAPPELAALLRAAPGLAHVEPWGGCTPPYDFHCPLMSLPHWLGIIEPRRLRGSQPYLRAAEDKVRHWQRRLEGCPGLRVGLVWSGSSRASVAELAAIDARRSVALDRWTPILSVPGCSFFSLQTGSSAAESKRLTRASIHDFSCEWRDFSDTAAVVANLDLVISVDTAVAHLAGALGKPVWLLNRYDCCWRWLLHRSDSPWYSSLRQFRQPRAGDWEPVIAQVAGALGAQALKRAN